MYRHETSTIFDRPAHLYGLTALLLLGGFLLAALPATPAMGADAALAPPTEPDKASAEPAANEQTTGARGAQPKAVCKEPTHDFGTIMIGPALEHTFEITNEGDAALQITGVKPTCGCTAAGKYPKSIAPGQTGQFPFRLDSNRVNGRFSKPIYISTNDPKNPRLTLALQGELKRLVDVTPTGAYFGRVYSEEPIEKSVKITNNSPQEMKIELEPVDEKAQFTFELKESRPGKEYELVVTSKPPYEPGSYARAMARLKTNIKGQELINVNVILANAFSVDVIPLALRVPTEANSTKVAGSGHAARVNITNYTKEPLTKVEVRASDEQIKTDLHTIDEGRRYAVNVRFPAGLELPQTGLKLVIETSDEKRPKIEVPIQPYTPPTAARRTPTKRPAMELVGEPAPKFELKFLNGDTISNEEFSSEEFKKHAATVLNFYAPNCGACKKQIPQLEKVRTEFEDKSVRFLNVTETMRGKVYTPEQIAEVMQQLQANLDLVIDPGNKVGKTYKITHFPTMFVVDRAGKVRNVYIGASGPLQAKKLLDEMVKEQNEPAT